jgi:hypothetical protein
MPWTRRHKCEPPLQPVVGLAPGSTKAFGDGRCARQRAGRVLPQRLGSGGSLRAGLATQAYLNGAGELAIMRQTDMMVVATMRLHQSLISS